MNELVTNTNTDIVPLIELAVLGVREDMRDNPYILEAIRVLPVEGYRSAIGAFWNAVVDDLRNKIIFRSISLFNKEISCNLEIKNYEDFQIHVTDKQLIEGAYKIGVIGWEAYKMLGQSREARNIFSGHAGSSEPSLVKVLAVISDCIKYVLNEEYPTQIIDIDEYIETLKSADFDRNMVAIENTLGDLPETYKNDLVNRLFTIYIHPDSSSSLTSNIEFIAPLLWKVLPKLIKIQIVRRLDQELSKANAVSTDKAFDFIHIVGGVIYLSHNSKRCKIEPLVEELKSNLDNWDVENKCVRELKQFSSVIIEECIDKYVSAITHTYVGRVGGSARYSRTDFYANVAATYIPDMFQEFNDRMASAFIGAIQESNELKQRIRSPSKLKRLRSLALIVDEKTSEAFEDQAILSLLVDESKGGDFFERIRG